MGFQWAICKLLPAPSGENFRSPSQLKSSTYWLCPAQFLSFWSILQASKQASKQKNLLCMWYALFTCPVISAASSPHQVYLLQTLWILINFLALLLRLAFPKFHLILWPLPSPSVNPFPLGAETCHSTPISFGIFSSNCLEPWFLVLCAWLWVLPLSGDFPLSWPVP